MTYGGPGTGHPGRPSPWADPATPTHPGAPYAGPPQPYGWPQPYGYPSPHAGWPQVPQPWAPPPPQRPATVVAAAVLAFVQTGIVLIASLYLWFFASVADLATTGMDGAYSSATVSALAREGTVLALVQLASAVALVVSGVVALTRRTRAAWLALVGSLAVQVLLAGYWAVRLLVLAGETNGSTGSLIAFAAFFAAGPAVGLGLLLRGSGRRWFESPPGP